MTSMEHSWMKIEKKKKWWIASLEVGIFLIFPVESLKQCFIVKSSVFSSLLIEINIAFRYWISIIRMRFFIQRQHADFRLYLVRIQFAASQQTHHEYKSYGCHVASREKNEKNRIAKNCFAIYGNRFTVNQIMIEWDEVFADPHVLKWMLSILCHAKLIKL